MEGSIETKGINMGKVKGTVTDEGRTRTKCGEFKSWGDFYKDKNGNQC